MIALFIGNNGATTAHDARLVITPGIVPGVQPVRCVEAQRAAAAGISEVPPGRVIEWYLGVGHELLSAPGQPDEFRLDLTGRAADGTEMRESFRIRFGDIRHSSVAGTNLEEIAQTLAHFRTEHGRHVQALLSALRGGEVDDLAPHGRITEIAGPCPFASTGSPDASTWRRRWRRATATYPHDDALRAGGRGRLPGRPAAVGREDRDTPELNWRGGRGTRPTICLTLLDTTVSERPSGTEPLRLRRPARGLASKIWYEAP